MKYISLIIFLLLTSHVYSQNACNYSLDSIKVNYKKNEDSLLAKIQQDSFTVSYNKKDIPGFIKEEFKCLNAYFALANPGEKYNATDIITRGLPSRQLIFMAKSANIFIITYNHGGWGWHQHILIACFTGSTITNLWASQANGDLNTVKSVIDYMKMSTIRKNIAIDSSYMHI